MASVNQWECPARLIIFTPIDPKIRKAVIIPAGASNSPQKPHNHPAYPEEKLTFAFREDYSLCAEAVGVFGSTVSQIDNGEFVCLFFIVVSYWVWC